jgi:hypothetical protein
VFPHVLWFRARGVVKEVPARRRAPAGRDGIPGPPPTRRCSAAPPAVPPPWLRAPPLLWRDCSRSPALLAPSTPPTSTVACPSSSVPPDQQISGPDPIPFGTCKLNCCLLRLRHSFLPSHCYVPPTKNFKVSFNTLAFILGRKA